MAFLIVHLKSGTDTSSIGREEFRDINSEVGSGAFGFGYDSESRNEFIWYPLEKGHGLNLDELSARLSRYPFFDRLEVERPVK